jgi:hypothetical protein
MVLPKPWMSSVMLAKDVSWTEHCRTVGYPRAKYSDSDMGMSSFVYVIVLCWEDEFAGY